METTIRVMGQKIRQLWTDSRLTLEEAAERAGCTPGFLSQVERNQAVPPITMLYAIAQALGVKVTDFFPQMTSVAKSSDPTRARYFVSKVPSSHTHSSRPASLTESSSLCWYKSILWMGLCQPTNSALIPVKSLPTCWSGSNACESVMRSMI